MSGGVDSSVAAALIKQAGFAVVGVYFKPWLSPAPNSQLPAASYCGWGQERQDAMRAAGVIGIPFKTWDFSREYGRKVAQYMVNGYRRGLTPNPDVMCNKEIKFGLFLKRALAEGADYIATGHYARLKPRFSIFNFQFSDKLRVLNPKQDTKYGLLKARDRNKDQTYFLWTLTQAQLKYCLFPIGDYTKSEVRKLAKKFGLPNWNKKDSQGVCFVGQMDVKGFLKQHISPKAGEIRLLETSQIIGQHDGIYYYTIGQRHGLNIQTGNGPFYVAGKDIKKNIIYVSREKKNLLGNTATVTKINWLGEKQKLPIDAGVKIRYRTETVPARIRQNGFLKTLTLTFKRPAKAISPGQSAVFYRGQQVLGGGVII